MTCPCKSKGRLDELHKQVARKRHKHIKKTWGDYAENLLDLLLIVLDKLIKCTIIIVASPVIILFVLISVLFSGGVKLRIPKKYFKEVTSNVSKELQN